MAYSKGPLPSSASPIDFTGNYSLGLYTAETTQRYQLGTRLTTADGRVFRYSYAGTGGVQSEFGACTPLKTITNAVAPTQASGAGAIGSTTVTITVGSGDGATGDGSLAKDELVGGYVVIGNGTNQHPQMRYIVGNTAVAATGGACTLSLDMPLSAAVTASTTNIEALVNPYAYVTSGNVTNSGYVSFLGMPAVTADAGNYFWLQTWGPCWITSNGTTCNSAGDRNIYFVANGSCVSGDDDSTTDNTLQMAGVAIDMSGSGASNAPFVYLQISQ